MSAEIVIFEAWYTYRVIGIYWSAIHPFPELLSGHLQKFLVVKAKATTARTRATILIPHNVNFLVLVSLMEGYKTVPASRPMAKP
ncbi:MAG: hypothetical protein EOO38_01965 [Cytophagaceae bacterium]|nr:MAG: hypothetical protein EOO38_01965 [Cytophagaceae bacterium]